MPQERLDIIVDLKDFATKEFRRLRRTTQAFGRGITGVFRGVTRSVFSLQGALAGVGLALSGKAIFDLIKGTSALGDQFGKLEAKVGVSAETLSALSFAAERSGADFTQLQTALRNGIKNLEEFARFGRGEAKDALELMSTGFQNAVKSGRSLESLLPDLSREFKALDSAQRVFVASKLFGGRAGASVIPLLTSDLEDLIQTAHRLGVVWTTEDADAAEDFEDAVTNLKSAMIGLRNQVILPLLPELQKFAESLTTGLVDNRADIVRFFADVVEGGGSLVATFVSVAASAEQITGRFDKLALSALKSAKTIELWVEVNKLLPGGAKASFVTMSRLVVDIRKLDERMEGLSGTTSDFGRNLQEFAKSLSKSSADTAERLRELANSASDFSEEVEELEFDVKGFADAILELQAAGPLDIDVDASGVTQAKEQLEDMRRIYDELQAQYQRTDLTAGLRAGFSELRQESTELGAAANRAVHEIANSIAGNATDAIYDWITGVKSAKEAFSELAKSILSDIARIIIQTLVLKAVQGVFGLAGYEGGGVIPATRPVAGTTPLRAQTGGVFQRRTFLEVAEAGQPEAVVPLPNGRSIPVEFRGDAGGTIVGGGTVINQNIYYTVNAATLAEESRLIERNGNRIAQIIAERNNSSLRFREAMQ